MLALDLLQIVGKMLVWQNELAPKKLCYRVAKVWELGLVIQILNNRLGKMYWTFQLVLMECQADRMSSSQNDLAKLDGLGVIFV